MPAMTKEERLKSVLRDNLKKRKKALRDRKNKVDENIEINRADDDVGRSESE